MELNILLVGVGGQGILTTSAILARAALKEDVNVITAETHGMAQRGGSVEVHVRFGEVYAPLIPFGGADVVISLEPVEAARYARYLNEKTFILLNSRSIIPPIVSSGLAKYPKLGEILAKLKEVTSNIRVVEASKIAEEVAGSIQSTNVVIIGMLARLVKLPFSYQAIEEAVREVLPERLHEKNLKALKAGYESVG